MRKLAMQRGAVAILDVGSSKICLPCLAFDGTGPHGPKRVKSVRLAGQRLRVIGAATTRSRGPLGEICAMQETERAVRTALQALQKWRTIRGGSRDRLFSLGAEPRSMSCNGRPRLNWKGSRNPSGLAQGSGNCDVPEYGERPRGPAHAQP